MMTPKTRKIRVRIPLSAMPITVLLGFVHEITCKKPDGPQIKKI